MFTQGTKQFGTWRVGHPSLSRHTGRPTQAILLAYGFCAFLTWFIFILTLKIRGEFFLIESLHVPLHKVVSSAAKPMPAVPTGLSLAIRPTGAANSLRVIFDTGQVFELPREAEALNEFLADRIEDMELSALIRKKISSGFGTAVLWVDAAVPLAQVQPLANSLVRFGFDTLRYAVHAEKAPSEEETH
ncbi:hypothetical protein EBU99_04130 [bacterium]|nr:hypothetical protein [bacterium]